MKKSNQLSFSVYEARLKMSSNDPVKIIFDNLNFSFIYNIVKNLYTSKTCQGYDPVSLFKALLLIYLGEAKSERHLASKLKFDSRLCALCDFDNFLKTPTHATFSVFRKKLGNNTFFQIFHQLVAQAFAYGIIKGFFTAADATHIWAYANPYSNSDTDANWGHKSKSFSFYGYKVHLFVDTHSQLPISISVTPGSSSDSINLKHLVSQATSIHPYMDFHISSLDAAYDSHDNYRLLNDNNITPIIPLNNRAKSNPILTNEISLTSDGHPVCSDGHKLLYWGFCKSRNRLKFRCPAALGKCSCLFKNSCSPSSYGRTFYLHPSDNIRLIGRFPRNSFTWKKLYNLRSSVERTNSELKSSHNLDKLLVRSLPKVKTHVYLSCIAHILKKFGSYFAHNTKPAWVT